MAYFRKRGKKWYYTLCWQDETGRQHKKEYVGGLTKQACAKAWRRAMEKVDTTGMYLPPSERTLADCLDDWLVFAKNRYKPNTYDSYESTVINHLVPAFGMMHVSKISVGVLQVWLDKQIRDYSYSTVKSYFSVLRLSFSWFFNTAKIIQLNPAQHLRMPRATFSPGKKNVRAFTPAEIKDLFKRFGPDHHFRAPLAISYYTGLRLGECLALTWDDIDMQTRVVHVRGSKYDKKGPGVVDLPKTRSSIRDVTFGQKLADELKRVQWQQRKDALAAGSFYHDDGYVCSKGMGLPMKADDMRYFGQYCHKTFGEGSFHWLRHTHATMLIENGLSLDYVSKRLGHSSMYTTANIYVDVTDQREKTAVRIMDAVL